MAIYFTKEGFQDLLKKIREYEGNLQKVQEDIQISTQQGSDIVHDNVGFEAGTRQETFWSRQIQELLRLKREAVILDPLPAGDEVMIGKKVTFKDLATRSVETYKIGSFMVFQEGNEISYNSPLARLLSGAKVGEIRRGNIGGREKAFEILEIK